MQKFFQPHCSISDRHLEKQIGTSFLRHRLCSMKNSMPLLCNSDISCHMIWRKPLWSHQLNASSVRIFRVDVWLCLFNPKTLIKGKKFTGCTGCIFQVSRVCNDYI